MKTKKLLIYSLIIMCVIEFTGCSMDKRLYTKGYNIQWYKNTKQDNTKEIVNNESEVNSQYIINSDNVNTDVIDNTISASVSDNKEIVIVKKEKIVFEKHVLSPYKSIITMPIRNIKKADSYVKSVAKEGGNKSRNWAAILGFILSFFIPIVAIWFCLIGMKSELRGLSIAGYIICLVSFLLQLLLLAASA